MANEVVGYVVICRNKWTGELHHIASGPRHMDPWTPEYAEREARRIHHNNDWLDCEVGEVAALRTADTDTEEE